MKKITLDGNSAAAKMAYLLSDMACIYPITPSSGMAELCDERSYKKEQNIFGNIMQVRELESEAGASAALHGSLALGTMTTTFTASQGLLLMIPNMYKIAGELLPCVFHVSARTIASHALSIFGDHSDVMATRGTGFNMLCSSNVQECLDMALCSHIIALETSLPILHFFDGFRTSHEIQKIDDIDVNDVKKILPYDKIKEFKNKALNPMKPHQQGTAQNPDIFFQNREACNVFYDKVYESVLNTFDKLKSITGRGYSPFEYYGLEHAEDVIVMMGSGVQTAIETCNFLNKNGYKVGVINVRLFRPFNYNALLNVLPDSVKRICVLDRTKESGAVCEPLCEDVNYAINHSKKAIKVIGGRYGIGGKEFTPACVKAVFDNLKTQQKDHFSVGINDDVTHLSLKLQDDFHIDNKAIQFKFFGLGSDGTVSANKNTIKIIGDNTDNFVQGYFEYDSKKSGSLTISHLRVSNSEIKSTYMVESSDFISIHNYSFLDRYDLLKGLKQNGTVLINTVLNEKELNEKLPNNFKKILLEKNANLFTINAQKIARECGLSNKINVIMQVAFFKISKIIDFNLAKTEINKAIIKTYVKKGETIVNNNLSAAIATENEIKNINLNNFKLTEKSEKYNENNDKYYNNFIKPIERLNGNNLPVSSFDASGKVPTDTSKFLKRGVSEYCPNWLSENCIQCGMCSFVCPHSAIRAVALSDEDLKTAPETFNTIKAIGIPSANYRVQVNTLDCTGCGLCAKICPARNKALVMDLTTKVMEKEKQNYKFSETVINVKTPFKKETVKGMQFFKPYFEFSGACAGCGETPYIKLVSTLFGENMIVANATGCSSIYSGNSPVCPYAKDSNGYGPSWANSLFEDNAQFGLGMQFAINYNKNNLKTYVMKYLESGTCKNDELKNLLNDWLSNNLNTTNENTEKIINLLKTEEKTEITQNIELISSYFAKKSVWLIGGDGWANDIGYGGLDHLLSSNENVNVLVLDSEVYSNTGGQSSKSTPKGANVKFASGGKKTRKKDLGLLSIMHKNCYVASICLGADMQQSIKAFVEAEKFNGPSIIIAYSPCVNHGYNLENANIEQKRAVECGYWNLYRYNPELEKPLSLDSGEPTLDYKQFLMGESRYSSLFKEDPASAEILFEESKNEANERRKDLKNILKSYE